jgi:hypothetical protein
LSVKLKLIVPLLTVCELLNVLRSSPAGSAVELDPHPAATTPTSAAASNAPAGARSPLIRSRIYTLPALCRHKNRLESTIGGVRRRRFGLLTLTAVTTLGVLGQAPAAAAPVVVLGPGRQVAVRDDRFLTVPPWTPAPSATAHAARARTAPARRGPAARPGRTVRSELRRLRRIGAITATAYRAYNASFSAALAAEKRLGGTRAAELTAITVNLHTIAAAGLLTPSRLPALFLTLDRNRQWWTTGPLLSYGQRVEFAGSQLVWEYYPGQGIELQPLGSFGRADGMYTAGPSQYPQFRALLGELIPLAATRRGALAWEYYFSFGGGTPPWTSAMSQGAAIEALTRAYKAFGDRSYLATADRALRILTKPPPVGVTLPTTLGNWYLLYSFAPGAKVLNGFLWTLIGLYDLARLDGNPLATRLFAAGDAEARAAMPSYDTGAWSLYQPGEESTLEYHQLVTGFLQDLCQRTGAVAYCSAALRFTAYLTTPPALELLSTSARAGTTSLRFSLSKYSRVGVVLLDGSQTLLATSADYPYGAHTVSVPRLTRPGAYIVRLAATDLAGNFNRVLGTILVS